MRKQTFTTGAAFVFAALLTGFFIHAVSPAFAAGNSYSAGVKSTPSNLPTYDYPQETDKNLYYSDAVNPDTKYVYEAKGEKTEKASPSNLPTYDYPQETDKNLYYPDIVYEDSKKKSSGRDDRTVFRKESTDKLSAAVGKWTLDADGGWHFSVDDKECKAAWIYAYNPYASGTQAKADWFYFDGNGVMVTGWFTEPGTGKRYYLNPVSDGTMGRWIENP